MEGAPVRCRIIAPESRHALRRMTAAALLGALIAFASPGAVAGSADAIAARTAGDPWARANRVGYAVQDRLNQQVFNPAGRLYRWLTPGPIGRGLHNLLVNLSEPGALINDMLQFRFRRAAVPAERFIINSTVGLLGLVDVAGRCGLVHHNNEFGVTLGTHGVPSGPYLYVPLIGPTTVRDLIGSGIDFVLDPVHRVRYPDRATASDTRLVVGGLDTYVMTQEQLNALLSGAVDPYATLRSVYLQNKQGEIDGNPIPLALPEFDELPLEPSAETKPSEQEQQATPASPDPAGSSPLAPAP